MKNKSLKPCPFCGNDDLYVREDVGYPTLYTINCKKCSASILQVDTSKKQIIDAWNTRTIVTQGVTHD
jgi:Lar family restriction alleviation protein